MYVCTTPPAPKPRFGRRVAWLASAVLFFAAITNQNAFAQNRKTNSNSGQAVLHITATVVPVAMLPPIATDKRDIRDTVVYNIPVHQLPMNVTSESRALPGVDGGAILKTITVVAQ